MRGRGCEQHSISEPETEIIMVPTVRRKTQKARVGLGTILNSVLDSLC